MLFRTLLCVVLLTGCSATVKYGKQPRLGKPASKAEACYQKQRLVLGDASAEVDQYIGTTRAVSSARGIVFYRDGHRISQSRAFELLDDELMQREYRKRRDEVARPARIYGLRVLAGTIIGAGGVTAIAFGADSDPEKVDNKLVVGGLGLLVVGAYIGLKAYPKWKLYRGMHHIYSQVLIDGHFGDRLGYFFTAYNRGVAKRCGYETLSIPLP
jgi:hypothetical protein